MKLCINHKPFLTLITLIAIFSILILPFGVIGQNDNEEGFIIIHIAKNGHYRSQYFYLYDLVELEIEVEVIEGGKIDVYLMTENQYSNTYTGFDGNEPSAFSYLGISKENISQFKALYEVPRDDDDDYYYYEYDSWQICVVLDNQDSNLTDTDAVPIGLVTVKLKTIEHERDYEIDEFEDPICYGALIVIIILVAVIIIVIYLSLRISKSKTDIPGPGKPPHFGHYPSYGVYPPYYVYPEHYPPPEGAESEKGAPPKAKPKIDDNENKE